MDLNFSAGCNFVVKHSYECIYRPYRQTPQLAPLEQGLLQPFLRFSSL